MTVSQKSSETNELGDHILTINQVVTHFTRNLIEHAVNYGPLRGRPEHAGRVLCHIKVQPTYTSVLVISDMPEVHSCIIEYCVMHEMTIQFPNYVPEPPFMLGSSVVEVYWINYRIEPI